MLDLGRWGWFRFRGTWSFLRLWNLIELRRLRNELQMFVVWRLPLWVINWAVVRAAAMAMGDRLSPGDIGYSDMWYATNPKAKQRAEEADKVDDDNGY